MASSRSVIQPGTVKGKTYKKQGGASATEKAVVALVVANAGGELAPAQERALATTLKRTPAMVKALVAEARGTFVGRAMDYVNVHFEAMKQALENKDPKSLAVAVKAAEWAIANINGDGSRVVDKASSEPQGQKIFIGVRVGNMDQKPTIDVHEVVNAS